MNFKEYKCPVCEKEFKDGDDVVVCPECGAPHHRECYDELEHCYYEDKHSADFSYENLFNENKSENGEYAKCPVCGADNPKELFYCSKCGAPLSDKSDTHNAQQNDANRRNDPNRPYGGSPFGTPTQNGAPFGYANPFDPMMGINRNEEIADGISAGEMSKFVGKSTPYFLQVFKKIKTFGSSRYNFAAFLFSGAYFFYRKMITLGVIFSFLTIGLTVGSYFIYTLPAYSEIYNIIAQTPTNSLYTLFYTDSSVLTTQQILLYNLPMILSLLNFVIKIICGAVANRQYLKHCTEVITRIKSEKSADAVESEIEAKGGINLALAVCVGVIYVAMQYIPYFIN